MLEKRKWPNFHQIKSTLTANQFGEWGTKTNNDDNDDENENDNKWHVTFSIAHSKTQIRCYKCNSWY